MTVIVLWSFAVFLAAVLSGILAHMTLTPRFEKKYMLLGWLAAAAGGYLVTWISYLIDLYNDFVGILGLSVLICVVLQLLYTELWTAKLFVGTMTSLIANVVTFMVCGTTDTFLGEALGVIVDTPYTMENILLYIGIKLVVYAVVFGLYRHFLCARTRDIIKLVGGHMESYILSPAMAVVVFYIINLITNADGIFPGTRYFSPLYLSICTIFILDMFQIFCSIIWSARAMKNEVELGIASTIQQDILPSIFPAFPDRKEFSLYASMNPAKEVGGDFYDFFLIDDNHIALVIADVSGKGVPAALFMVISKTLIKNRAQQGGTPSEILADVNEQLCENNQADMFVTVWLGILELSTGKVIASNAGHEYPAIHHSGGKYELMMDEHGFVLGGMPGISYSDYEFQLDKGSRLYLYTDGVAEATNAGNMLFGTERMLAALNEEPFAEPEQILKNVRREIDAFVQGASQFDDITMLCLKYMGT